MLLELLENMGGGVAFLALEILLVISKVSSPRSPFALALPARSLPHRRYRLLIVSAAFIESGPAQGQKMTWHFGLAS